MEKMDKRALSAIPRPKVTPALLRTFQNMDRKAGLITTATETIGGKETLIVNVFKATKHTELHPSFRIFCQMDGDISQDLTTEKTRWITGTFANTVGDWYAPGWGKSFTDYRIASEAHQKRIKNFITCYEQTVNKIEIMGSEFNDYLNAYQWDIRDRRRRERNQKILDAIDQRMNQFGDLPEDYPEFIDKVVFDRDHFLFYSRKERFGYCTHCGKTWTLSEEKAMEEAGIMWSPSILNLAHNKETICPMCHHPVIAKSAGMPRGNLEIVRWSVCVQPAGEDVLVRYIRHIKSFRTDYKNPDSYDIELFRTVHGKDGQEDYEWGTSMITRSERWIYPKSHMGYFTPSEYSWPRTTVLYNTSWEILSDTRLRYCCIDRYLDNIVGTIRQDPSPWEIDKWFNFYSIYPFVEQFMKLGWYQLVHALMFDAVRQRDLQYMHHEKTVYQSLRMTKAQFRFLRKVTRDNPQLIDLNMIWYAAEIGIRLSEDDFRELRTVCKYSGSDFYQKLMDLCVFSTPHKIISWINRQKKDALFKINDYLTDYITWCKELKVNLHDEYNLLPPNFQRRHDEMYMAYLKEKDKAEYEKRMAYNRMLEIMRQEMTEDNPENMHLEGLFIRLPMQINELKDEGEALHHCVATYMDQVMKGQTMIFFIRKEEEPEKPFYTLEWKNHKIVQCRGMRNCDMTPEVKAFTTIFSEKMLAFENAMTQPKRIRQKVMVV